MGRELLGKVRHDFLLRFFFFQDIFRKYPNKYESIIATLCENLDTLDEPEARSVLIV